MQIDRVLVVSNSHLTREEVDLFDQAITDGEWSAAVGGDHMEQPLCWAHGWMFFVGGGWPPEQERIGPGFIALIKMARAAGIEWIRFDSDGPLVDGVPTFE